MSEPGVTVCPSETQPPSLGDGPPSPRMGGASPVALACLPAGPQYYPPGLCPVRPRQVAERSKQAFTGLPPPHSAEAEAREGQL